MTWTAPEVTRERPPNVAEERAALEGWLAFHRATLLMKCQGLTGEQLALRSVPPSSLSLLGLVRHMAEVERGWFRQHFGAQTELPDLYDYESDPDAEFNDVDPARAEADFAAFRQECQLADEAAAGHSLEETFLSPRGKPLDLRWVYIHMIEEYARHNGHADLLRERIDGATGD